MGNRKRGDMTGILGISRRLSEGRKERNIGVGGVKGAERHAGHRVKQGKKHKNPTSKKKISRNPHGRDFEGRLRGCLLAGEEEKKQRRIGLRLGLTTLSRKRGVRAMAEKDEKEA